MSLSNGLFNSNENKPLIVFWFTFFFKYIRLVQNKYQANFNSKYKNSNIITFLDIQKCQ